MRRARYVLLVVALLLLGGCTQDLLDLSTPFGDLDVGQSRRAAPCAPPAAPAPATTTEP